MKNQIRLLLILVLFLQIACNNSSKDENKNITSTDNKIDSLQAIIKQYPDSLLLKENLIQYYRDLNDYKKAIELVNKYIVEDTIEARLQHIKAVLLLENKDTIQSLRFFEKSIELQPNPEDYLYVANIFATQKDQESLSLTDSIIKNYSPYFLKEALLIKGIYFAGINDLKNALFFFDKALDVDFTFMEAYREKAKCYLQCKKYNEAIEILKKAITLKNSYEEGYYLLGQVYEKQNKKSEAIDAYQKALLYVPDYYEAAMALKRLGL